MIIRWKWNLCLILLVCVNKAGAWTTSDSYENSQKKISFMSVGFQSSLEKLNSELSLVPVIEINKDTESYSISDKLQFAVGGHDWSEIEALGIPDGALFQNNTKSTFLRPLKKEYFWMRFGFKNTSQEKIEKVVYLPHYISSRIEGFVLAVTNEKNNPKLIAEKSFLMGSSVPRPSRDLQENSPLSGFSIQLQPNQIKYIYLVVNNRFTFSNSLIVSSEKNFIEHSNNEKNYFLFFFGGLFAIICYNLFLTLYLRDKSYLVYVLFSVSMTLTVALLAGLLDLFPSILGSNLSYYVNLQTAFSSFFALQFMNIFLQIKNKNERYYKFINWYSSIQFILTFAFFFGPSFLNIYSGRFVEAVILVGCALCIGTGFWAWIKKQDSFARFYLLSWAVLISCVVWWVFSNFGIIPKTAMTRFSITIGTLGEMLILSFVLAYRIKMLDQAKAKAEIKAMQKDQYQRLLRIFAHDVSNPLSIINMQSRFLLDAKYFQRHGPEKIGKSIIKAAEHVERILEFVRKNELEQSKISQKLDLKKVDMKELLEEAQFIFNNRIQEKQIHLEISRINQTAMIMADKDTLLHNVLNNVLSNAIKFTPQGGVIKIEVIDDNEFHVLRVVDSGVGMAEEDIEKINSGKDLESTDGTDGEKGTGFGIDLIRNTMRSFAGEVVYAKVKKSEKSETPINIINTANIQQTNIEVVSRMFPKNTNSVGTQVDLKFPKVA